MNGHQTEITTLFMKIQMKVLYVKVTESMIRLNWSSIPEISEYYIKFQTVNQLDQVNLGGR